MKRKDARGRAGAGARARACARALIIIRSRKIGEGFFSRRREGSRRLAKALRVFAREGPRRLEGSLKFQNRNFQNAVSKKRDRVLEIPFGFYRTCLDGKDMSKRQRVPFGWLPLYPKLSIVALPYQISSERFQIGRSPQELRNQGGFLPPSLLCSSLPIMNYVTLGHLPLLCYVVIIHYG